MNEARSSAVKLPLSKGAVMEAASLVTELELLLLRTEPAPKSTPLGDFPNTREEALLPPIFRISLDSLPIKFGYRAAESVTMSAGQRTRKGWTLALSGGEVTVFEEISTG